METEGPQISELVELIKAHWKIIEPYGFFTCWECERSMGDHHRDCQTEKILKIPKTPKKT